MPRSDGVNEDRLEMEFWPVLKRELQSWFGTDKIELLKPSKHQEALTGFDQGFYLGDDNAPRLSHDRFLRELGQEIDHGVTTSSLFYVGYFLQFKVVERMTRRTPPCPSAFTSPYYRAELDLEPNGTTGRSQHATLRRLCALPGADVYYAFPMVFDVNVLKLQASLDALALASVAEAPKDWKDGEKHFVMFQKEDGDPWWCSDPVPGRRFDLRRVLERAERLDPASTTRWLESARLEYRRGLPAEARTRGGYPPAMRLLRVALDPDIPPLFPQVRG